MNLLPITLPHFFNDNEPTLSAAERYQNLLDEQAQLNLKLEFWRLLQRWFHSDYFRKLAAKSRQRLTQVNTLLAFYPQTAHLSTDEWVNDEVCTLVLEHVSPVEYSPEWMLNDF